MPVFRQPSTTDLLTQTFPERAWQCFQQRLLLLSSISDYSDTNACRLEFFLIPSEQRQVGEQLLAVTVDKSQDCFPSLADRFQTEDQHKPLSRSGVDQHLSLNSTRSSAISIQLTKKHIVCWQSKCLARARPWLSDLSTNKHKQMQALHFLPFATESMLGAPEDIQVYMKYQCKKKLSSNGYVISHIKADQFVFSKN